PQDPPPAGAVDVRSLRQPLSPHRGRTAYFFLPTSWPTTPPTAAPPTVPAVLPPVSTLPATPPTAAPAIVALSWCERFEQAPGPAQACSGFVLDLVLAHQLLLDVGRHGLVMAQFQRVAPLAAGHAIQARLVAVQLRQWHLPAHGDAAGLHRVRAVDLPALGRQVAGDIAHGLLVRRDLHLDDRLQHDGLGFQHGIDERLAARRGEGDVLRVDRVRLAVVHD